MVSNLESMVFGLLDDDVASDIEYLYALLFSIPPFWVNTGSSESVGNKNESSSYPGLLHFLLGAMNTKDKEIIKGKVHALRFLALLIKDTFTSGKSTIDSYKAMLFNFTYDFFKRQEGGDIRVAALQVLKNLLRCNDSFSFILKKLIRCKM